MEKFKKLLKQLLADGFITDKDLTTTPKTLEQGLSWAKIPLYKKTKSGTMFVTLNNELFIEQDLDMVALGFTPTGGEYEYVTDDPLSGNTTLEEIQEAFSDYFSTKK